MLWLIVVAPTIDWERFTLDLAHPACALPALLLALAVLGILWADGSWAIGLRGIKPVTKLLLIPFLLYHFQRTQRGSWVLIAFLASCTLLMILSWIVLFVPGLKPAHTLSAGVPVKNYIDQNQEFALCAFALALPALIAWRWQKWKLAVGCLALALAFIVNMLFVALARTALIYMAVLLVLFAWRHLGRRAMFALLAGAIVAGERARLVVAEHDRDQRVGGAEVDAHRARRAGFFGVRFARFTDLEELPLSAPAHRRHRRRISGARHQRHRVDGAATGLLAQVGQVHCRGPTARPRHRLDQGAIRARRRRADRAGGRDRQQPAQPTLAVAVQWGLLGVTLLYAMWLNHLLLFTGRTLAAWIGLVVVVQNVVSSLLNSHLFDFHEGWLYVLGVGVAGGMSLRASRRRAAAPDRGDAADPQSFCARA